MKSKNRVDLIGHMGTKPEKRFTAGKGTPYVAFSLATTYRFRNESGDKQERTTWHKLVAYGALADVVDNFTKTGSALAIEGRLQNRDYNHKAGHKVEVTEILVTDINLLDKRPADPSLTQGEPAAADLTPPENDFSADEGIPF